METESDVAFGTWNQPGFPFIVRYPLHVFHEIDFFVTEGHRRIPHGGIEHGGVLFGKQVSDTVQIEAFRPIECEHSAGPLFVLSESDMQRLNLQMMGSQADPELSGLRPVGLFISHGRRDLNVSAHEQEIVARLFTEPWQVLMLLKPQKLKATRFGMLHRGGEPVAGSDLGVAAFTLSLAGRPDRKARSKSSGRSPAEAESNEPQPKRRRNRLSADPIEGVREKPKVATPPIREIVETPQSPPPMADSRLPASRSGQITESAAHPFNRLFNRRFDLSFKLGAREHLVAAAAAASLVLIGLCWLWFYWNYLQAAVALHAASRSGGVSVNWAAGETKNARQAELLVWSGKSVRRVNLSPAEKTAGEAIVAVDGSDLTIELVSHHWLHDRRGLLRLIR